MLNVMLTLLLAAAAVATESDQFAVGCSLTALPSDLGLGAGNTTYFSLGERSAILNQRTRYKVTLPSDYEPGTPYPLLLWFHGWGGNLDGYTGSGFHSHGKTSSYIVVTATGYDDDDNYNSWNGAGTTGSPGPLGPVCSPNVYSYCYYSSCGHCDDNCWWTTCEDSVQQVLWIIEEVASMVCVDGDRLIASGESNGGNFLHALAGDERSNQLFSAYLPTIGDAVHGYNNPPPRPAVLAGIWGIFDTTDPSMDLGVYSKLSHQGSVVDQAYQGYFYHSARATTLAWAKANSCTGAPVPYDVTDYLPSSVTCKAWLDCAPGGRVLECLNLGGHWTPDAPASTRLLADFALATPPTPEPSVETWWHSMRQSAIALVYNYILVAQREARVSRFYSFATSC